MSWRVPLTEVQLADEEVGAVLETMRSEWLTMGPRTQELEEAFAERVGAPHAVAVSSGSAALHLACRAVGLAPGDEAVVPTMTFVATAHAPYHCGATVVLADSRDARDPNLDPGDVAARITPRTKAVLVTHLCGYPAAVEQLRGLCEERGVVLVEDCAQAAGATLDGARSVGTIGDAGCFSFFAKSALGSGEGGLLVTGDAGIAERVRSLRSHAMTTVTWDRHRGHAETYDVVDLGFNYRIDEMRASLAAARLGRLDGSLEGLRRAVTAYRERLTGIDGVELPFDEGAVQYSGHYVFAILLRDVDARDALRTRLHARGVQTTLYPALHRLAAYGGGDADGSLARAEAFADRHCALPLFPTLTEERIDLVVAEVRDALLQ